MARKHNRTGRSKCCGRFVQIHEYVMRSYAWRRLSPLGRCAWLEINLVYNGSNNGRLAVSARSLGERLDVGPSAAAKAIRDLVMWGFLDPMQASSFSQKRRAAEYRLTHLPCNVKSEPASKRFMKLGETKQRISEAAE